MSKILLADHDAAIRRTLRQVLIGERYDVVLASTGREAAAKFMNDLPDLVLLDQGLPDRDGWDVFGLMHSTHPSVPVIMITAQPHQYEHAAELRIDALMEEPLDIPLLLETIRNYLAKSYSQRIRELTRPDFRTVLLDGHAQKSSQCICQ